MIHYILIFILGAAIGFYLGRRAASESYWILNLSKQGTYCKRGRYYVRQYSKKGKWTPFVKIYSNSSILEEELKGVIAYLKLKIAYMEKYEINPSAGNEIIEIIHDN